MQVIIPLNTKVIGKSGLYKSTECFSQLHHVSVLGCCKTSQWLDKGHHLQLLIPNGYVLNKNLIITHYLSMYNLGPHGQPLLGRLTQSHRDREKIFVTPWFFTQLFVVCSEQKCTALSQTEEIEGDTISGAELDVTRPELGSHSTVCRGITI